MRISEGEVRVRVRVTPTTTTTIAQTGLLVSAELDGGVTRAGGAAKG